jgi:putative membrane protein
MKRASRFFSDADQASISEAIAAAEGRTSGEIVPVVATDSGRYDRAEDLFGAVVALVALIASWILFQGVRPVEGDWASGQTIVLGLLPLVLIVAVGFALGALLSTRLPVLKLAFLSGREMQDEVERSASEAFYRFRVRRTAGGTGVLIYISLFERMVRVMGDEAIAEKLDQGAWDEVRDLVIDGLRNGRPTEGLQQAIALCGDRLAEHFPIQPDDVNELTNELRIID